jgi:DNA-binding transcriptional LysR family regulator
MDVTVQQLRMLREVSAQGTIGRAATELGYTSSAVSQQLSSLEKVTGVAVLERVGRNVQLTDAGRELVGHADIVLAQLEEARAAVERVTEQAAGVLSIGVIESVAATLLPGVWRRLRSEHPDLTIRIRQVLPIDGEERVRTGSLDASFTIDYADSPGVNEPLLATERVCRDWFRLAVPVDHPLAEGSVSLGEVSGLPLIAAPPAMSCGKCVLDACRGAGFEPAITHEVDDYTTSLLLVAAGAGVALIPDLGLHTFIPEGVVVKDLTRSFSRTVELVHRRSSAQRPALRAFIEAVRCEAVELGLDLDLD